MGNNLDKLPKVDNINFSMKKRLDIIESPNQKYYFQYFKDYQLASPNEKQYLASLVVDLYKKSFSTSKSIDEIISYYLHFAQAVSIDLIFLLDKKNHEPKGFTIFMMIEEYLEPENYTNENRYLVSTHLVGINPKLRRGGLYNSILQTAIYLNLMKYPNRNYIHFDIIINPAVYYMALKSSQRVFPSESAEMSGKQLELFIKIRNKFECDPVAENKPYLVYDPLVLEEKEKIKFKQNYDKFPRDMKYHIDQTKLENNVGIACIALGVLIERNSLNLTAKSYINLKNPDFEIFEYSFICPKL